MLHWSLNYRWNKDAVTSWPLMISTASNGIALDLVRHQMKQDVFLASLLGRLVELEAANAAHQVRKNKRGFMKRFFRIA